MLRFARSNSHQAKKQATRKQVACDYQCAANFLKMVDIAQIEPITFRTIFGATLEIGIQKQVRIL
jgi:hypothetical protein